MRRTVAACVLTVTAALGFAAAVGAQDPALERPVFTVAPNGHDGADGSAERPWRTISKAARSVPPGAIVDIRAGTYAERVAIRVSGAPGSPITFRAHEGERVTISGKGLPRMRDSAGLVQIDSRADVELVGLELRDHVEKGSQNTPAGVWITGTSRNITLRGLDVHDISARRGNAHGIAVYGTSGTTPITGVRIEGSSVHDLRLGASEAIVVNGNVDGWAVVGNTIDDVDNIAIDAIGYEGTAPRNDRARNGMIADNVISDVDTLGNRAYDEEDGNCRCAGGIYVDGGRSILIERNRVTRANLGIELASEHRHGATSDVIARNNLVTHSDRAGLTMGGYDTKRGKTERVRVVNNTFLDNDRLRDGVGEIVLNYRLLNSSVLNNVLRARPPAIMVTNVFRQNSGNVFDGNLWFAPGKRAAASRWQWRGRLLRGFAAWRAATNGDAAGRYADPLLAPDASPLPGSPTIDAGAPTPLAGDTDLAGAPRLQGAALDVGAFESIVAAS